LQITWNPSISQNYLFLSQKGASVLVIFLHKFRFFPFVGKRSNRIYFILPSNSLFKPNVQLLICMKCESWNEGNCDCIKNESVNQPFYLKVV
jgi:hypothetical protein